MTICKHELKQIRMSLLIWGSALGIMILVSMIIYPEMKNNTGDMFENMGMFSEAFGMDKLDINTITGYYGVQAGTVIGIGGAFFAALIGIGILSKEESRHTAEFLFTHPVSRRKIIIEKGCAMLLSILLFNLLYLLFSLASFAFIGEMKNVAWDGFWLFHLAQCIMQMQFALICFGMSAYIKRGGIGLGIGFAALMYFLNIICNLSTHAQLLKFITPYQYAEPSQIISTVSIDSVSMIVGVTYAIIGMILALWYYNKKDIVS